jgi:hypothetical protein
MTVVWVLESSHYCRLQFSFDHGAGYSFEVSCFRGCAACVLPPLSHPLVAFDPQLLEDIK